MTVVPAVLLAKMTIELGLMSVNMDYGGEQSAVKMLALHFNKSSFFFCLQHKINDY